MENNKKIVLSKSKCIIFIAVVIICIAITFILASHSTYYKYNDWWIIGKTYDQVEERYGEFEITFGTCRGYYIGDDDGSIMPTYQPLYYWMEIDENGIIIKVYVATRYGG